MIYFHSAPIPLEVGSVIQPGNWGRIINLYSFADLNNTLSTAFRETLLENARLEFARDKPSRLNCIFACPTAEALEIFCRANARTRDIPYEIEPVDSQVAIHEGDYNLPLFPALSTGDAQKYFYMKELPLRYQRYWQDQPNDTSEILIGGPVRITRRLASFVTP